MKKSILIGILFLLSAVSVHATEFSDVSPQDPHGAAINYLSNEGIMKGQGGEIRFDPDGNLNRAEWSVIMSRSLGEEPSTGGFCFPDVRDEWYAPSVCFANQRGWIKGYAAGPEAGLFVPTNFLNVAEVLVTLGRQRSWQVTEGNQWYTGALLYAQNANLVDLSWSFDHRLTRAEAAEILFRTIAVQRFNVQRYDPLLADLMTPTVTSEPTGPTTSSPIITLRPFPDMPAKAALARGSLYVPVLRFTLESDQPVTLNQLTVRRVSLGNTTDLERGRLVINGDVLRENTFTSDSNVNWRNLNRVMIPGQILLVEFNVDFIENASGGLVYQFQVEPSQILFSETDTVVQGDKVIGEEFRTSNIAADRVTIKNPTSKLNIPFTQTERAIIAKFTIKAGEHNVLLKRIKLENRADFDPNKILNYRLTSGSQEISFVKNLDQFALDFLINDHLLEAGEERTFSVLADILDARTFDQIRFVLVDASDLYAFDIEYGFGTRVDNQFNEQTAWCLGSDTITCPSPGLRKHCTQEDIDSRVIDCEAQ